jgi:hypothetical protein
MEWKSEKKTVLHAFEDAALLGICSILRIEMGFP